MLIFQFGNWNRTVSLKKWMNRTDPNTQERLECCTDIPAPCSTEKAGGQAGKWIQGKMCEFRDWAESLINSGGILSEREAVRRTGLESIWNMANLSSSWDNKNTCRRAKGRRKWVYSVCHKLQKESKQGVHGRLNAMSKGQDQTLKWKGTCVMQQKL